MEKPNLKHSLGILPLLAISVLVLPGCDYVASLAAFTCQFSPDSPHCYQDAAVQSGNPEDCNKVAQKEEFKKLGSNPPQDKCKMMVAANKEDPSICNTLKGGAMSYTKEDCEGTVADTATKPSTCSAMSGSAVGTCVNKVTEKTTAEIDALKNSSDKSPEKIQALQQKMEELSKMQQMMSDVMKAQYDMQRAAIQNMRN
ncbi:MAG: hypothetical protein WC551_01525 [Patescibacteria group bacterium]